MASTVARIYIVRVLVAAILAVYPYLLVRCTALFLAGTGGERAATLPNSPGIGATPLEIVLHEDGINVTHALGSVTIPRTPRRICSLAFTDELLATGIVPASAASTNGRFPDYLEARLHGVAKINQMMGIGRPNFEDLALARPDVIIASTNDVQTYRQLSSIAPTIVMGVDGDNNRARLTDLGRLFDRAETAGKEIERYNADIARAKRELAEIVRDRKVAFLRILGKQFYMHGHTRGGIMLYDELGLHAPSVIDKYPKGVALNTEALLTLDADYIFVAAEANVGAKRSLNVLRSHPAWARVPAVAAGRVFELNDQCQWLRQGFLAKSRMLEEIKTALASTKE